jgi:NTE family protein
VAPLGRFGLRDLRTLFSGTERATSFEAFCESAAALDARTGADAWRADDESDVYDLALLREHTAGLARLRERRDAAALSRTSKRRSIGTRAISRRRASTRSRCSAPSRWSSASGRRSSARSTGCPAPRRRGSRPRPTLARFERAARVFGRSALLLSGGASLGFFHVGVAKALFEHGLLPSVLSGASMGAMVACGLCARDDDELRALFADVGRLRTDALLRLGPREMARQRCAFDERRLREVIRHNNGELTFAEAFARSGRVVNVSLSPTRMRQKPRLLCHLNAPDVTLESAAAASAAVPWAFPPVTLEQRGRDGETRPYMPSERWIDGSFKGDVPTQRLARLHGVNHFIVSQVNPHVAPLRRLVRRRGLVPFLVDAAASSVRVQLAHDLGLVRRALAPTPLFAPIDLAHALADQGYGGDIDIHPPLRPIALLRTFTNISRGELDAHILDGERAIWPLLPRLRDQTRVERALARAIATLQRPGADQPESTPAGSPTRATPLADVTSSE